MFSIASVYVFCSRFLLWIISVYISLSTWNYRTLQQWQYPLCNQLISVGVEYLVLAVFFSSWALGNPLQHWPPFDSSPKYSYQSAWCPLDVILNFGPYFWCTAWYSDYYGLSKEESTLTVHWDIIHCDDSHLNFRTHAVSSMVTWHTLASSTRLENPSLWPTHFTRSHTSHFYSSSICTIINKDNHEARCKHYISASLEIHPWIFAFWDPLSKPHLTNRLDAENPRFQHDWENLSYSHWRPSMDTLLLSP